MGARREIIKEMVQTIQEMAEGWVKGRKFVSPLHCSMRTQHQCNLTISTENGLCKGGYKADV